MDASVAEADGSNEADHGDTEDNNTTAGTREKKSYNVMDYFKRISATHVQCKLSCPNATFKVEKKKGGYGPLYYHYETVHMRKPKPADPKQRSIMAHVVIVGGKEKVVKNVIVLF